MAGERWQPVRDRGVLRAVGEFGQGAVEIEGDDELAGGRGLVKGFFASHVRH